MGLKLKSERVKSRNDIFCNKKSKREREKIRTNVNYFVGDKKHQKLLIIDTLDN